jgi:hypothetical protein
MSAQAKRYKYLMFLLVIYNNFRVLLCTGLEKITRSRTNIRYTHDSGVTSLVARNHHRGHGQERVVLEWRTRTISIWYITIIYNTTIIQPFDTTRTHEFRYYKYIM